jgi:3-deoxy-D-manno-octulosonic-acid transferase
VGEVQAAIPLIRAARREGYSGAAVISTTTVTGRVMASKIGAGTFDRHIYYPWDKLSFVRSALDTVRPWAFAATETELWPNMLWELKRRGVPAFLVNGRVSDRSVKRLRRPLAGAAGRELYGLFEELYVRGGRDRERLLSLGVPEERIFVFGDNKIDALIERKKSADTSHLKRSLHFDGEAPFFIAGSTHEGEDEPVLEAFSKVKAFAGGARLIIAPRHPERAGSVAQKASEHFSVSLLSESKKSEVTVADRIGVLFDLYSLCTAAFVGGSLVDKGGQNILEPAIWNVPLQFGPHMEDFRDASEHFLKEGGAAVVRNAEGLASEWLKTAQSSELKERCAKASEAYFSKHRGAASKMWRRVARYAGQKP